MIVVRRVLHSRQLTPPRLPRALSCGAQAMHMKMGGQITPRQAMDMSKQLERIANSEGGAYDDFHDAAVVPKATRKRMPDPTPGFHAPPDTLKLSAATDVKTSTTCTLM
mmetsp:Transcript_13395/g.30442  ORF Transcript_13395/g.30442 Transcript_13395/m.30442 type:complete len:109 (+) Transcript_13395:1592-1918(+)